MCVCVHVGACVCGCVGMCVCVCVCVCVIKREGERGSEHSVHICVCLSEKEREGACLLDGRNRMFVWKTLLHFAFCYTFPSSVCWLNVCSHLPVLCVLVECVLTPSRPLCVGCVCVNVKVLKRREHVNDWKRS